MRVLYLRLRRGGARLPAQLDSAWAVGILRHRRIRGVDAVDLLDAGATPGKGSTLTLLEPVFSGLDGAVMRLRGIEVVGGAAVVQELDIRLADGGAGHAWVWPPIEVPGHGRLVGSTPLDELIEQVRRLSGGG